MCCHLALLGLVQSKPSWSAQACTAQAQAELDGTTCAVYPAPQTLGLVVCGRLMTSLLLWPMAWRAWPWPPLQVLNFVPRSEIQLGALKKVVCRRHVFSRQNQKGFPAVYVEFLQYLRGSVEE